MTIKVLSIDGGGMRGVIPAIWLAEIERRTGRPIAKLFDLIAGTSTGGILALGLVKPGEAGSPEFSAEDLLALYEEHGREIFQRSLWHRFVALDSLLEEKYPSEGIDRVLKQYFEEVRLSQAVTAVLTTAYDIELRNSYFFKSHRAKTDPTRNFLMADAARATSAAPTYFEPARIAVPGSPSNDYLALIDGGVFANNPAMCAYVEAIGEKETFGDGRDVLVVSLGTGELTRMIPYDEAKTWGLAKWAQPLLSVVFDGVSDTVGYQLDQVLAANRYFRFQVTLTQGSDDMDDTSKTNLHALERLAQQFLHDHEEEFDALCKELTPP